MPDAMIDAIDAAAKFERVFSLGVEYLMPAIVDMRLYLAADGGDVDALAIEKAAYAELGMPAAVDAIFRLPHQTTASRTTMRRDSMHTSGRT